MKRKVIDKASFIEYLARIIEECYEGDLTYIQHLEAYDTIVSVEELTEACDILLEE